MNLFYLDKDPAVAAALQCDKHVVKMIVETAQLLSTAWREYEDRGYIEAGTCDAEVQREDGVVIAGVRLYKTTHKNHPSAVWVRSGLRQMAWTTAHLDALLEEYTLRFGRTHKTRAVADRLMAMLLVYCPRLLEVEALIKMWTEPPACVSEAAKATMPEATVDRPNDDDVVAAYQAYYLEKAADWASRGMAMKWTAVTETAGSDS